MTISGEANGTAVALDIGDGTPIPTSWDELVNFYDCGMATCDDGMTMP